MLPIDNLELPVCRSQDVLGGGRRMLLTSIESTPLQSIQQLQERPDETLQLSTLTEGAEKINHN